uniref:Uncharacterized protein n=1 Tax=Cyprinus carpio carpio TaxID=630221 RepID=A0A9J7XJ11_CYPCA
MLEFKLDVIPRYQKICFFVTSMLLIFQLFLEDPDKGDLYRVDLEKSLLDILQHQKCSVKAGTPSFIVLVSGSPFSKQFLSGKKVQRLK